MAKRTVAFSLDTETDADILGWLDAQRNRSEAIREVLRAAIVPTPALDLAAIRQVVDAALREHLQGLILTDGDAPAANGATGEDPELAARLDELF